MLRSEGLVWLIGAVVWSLAAYRGSNCLLARAMDGLICGSTAAPLALADQLPLPSSDDCKARLVRFPCKTRYIRIRGFSFSFYKNKSILLLTIIASSGQY